MMSQIASSRRVERNISYFQSSKLNTKYFPNPMKLGTSLVPILVYVLNFYQNIIELIKYRKWCGKPQRRASRVPRFHRSIDKNWAERASTAAKEPLHFPHIFSIEKDEAEITTAIQFEDDGR